ncbi:AMP-binding protein [Salinispirillum sp. LH 10-3-1]|uniref:AMP-binding protein n=1 Tax=Salinispirillum sp. LH 10-3-1 TaxID=2952525 RepID=A0AB38YIQ7_9GAMM
MEMFDLLAQRARVSPTHLAVEDLGTGRTFTYTELNREAAAFATAALTDWGLSAGDRIAYLGHSRAEFFAFLFGCAKAGLVLVPLNWRLAPPELEVLLHDCAPQALVYTAAFSATVHTLAAAHPTMTLVALDATDEDAEQLAQLAPASLTANRFTRSYQADLNAVEPDVSAYPPRDPDAPWYLLYTSGTTGRPKGVIQTFRMMLANYFNIGLSVALTREDVLLNVLPLFHTGGINLFSTGVLLVGGTVLIAPSFEPDQAIEVLSTRATLFFGVPAVYQTLLEHPDFSGEKVSAVRSWSCGGAALALPVAQRFVDMGIQVRTGFGMTETGPAVFLLEADRVLDKIGSVGVPQLLAEVRLVDPSGNDILDQRAGEMLVRGPGITPGYWRQPDATQQAIDADGWLRTGDIARRDSDGYYYIVDRCKDMFISGGENVYPAEVEQVLLHHPDIKEAAVIGVRDERWGEVGRAFVVCHSDLAPEPEAIKQYCRQHLAGYKIPHSIAIVPTLPRNALGKITKQELRDATV